MFLFLVGIFYSLCLHDVITYCNNRVIQKYFYFKNSYDKELDELNKEIEIIENGSQLMNIKSQIKNYNETLQQITSANESLKMGINKSNID